VLAAFEALRDRLPDHAQAVRNGLALVELPGRFQVVPGQPALVLDVSHNPQAVAVLALNLDAMGFYPRTHAVFGAMRDKDTLPGPAGDARARISCHDNPSEALAAAAAQSDPADRIVVFGSFYTVGGVLKDGLPRLAARHLA
jgi:dihydrofolate synthase/folylpolyglutamate synthase